MSEELEKLKILYGEWARGDYSRSDIFHPEMRIQTFGMGDPIEAESYEGFVDVMRDWLSAWERPLTIEADEYIESGDRILALVRWKGRGKGSGAEMEASGAHLWTFRDGLVVDYRVYRDREEARSALGSTG
jgi:ketosteroid isomerase-like protein